MQSLEYSFLSLSQRIQQATLKASRDFQEVTLLAVTKKVSPEKIIEAYQLGQRHFAENYLQEAIEKQVQLKEYCPDIVWHFIGSIQSRKAATIAQHFDWVHGVDRPELIKKLAVGRPDPLKPLHICFQVNISGEQTKHGFEPELEPLKVILLEAQQEPSIRCRGLMGMAAPDISEAEQKKQFQDLADLHIQLKPYAGSDWNILSMGMSADLEAAIQAGATHIRIGSALFGSRL